MADTTKRRTIKSDETLFDIIEYVHASHNVGVTEIANELGIAKSTVHAHLATLNQRGYVVNDGGAYRIGLQFLQKGLHAQTTYPVYQRAEEKVKHLAKKTGERAWCQIEESGLAYYLCGAVGDHPVHPPVEVGASVYLHQIAGGKSILAHLPDERISEIIDRYGLPASTDYTITDEASLFEELEAIRDRGYAYNMEESLRGLHAIGAPIRNQNGDVLGALSISGPANRLKGEALERDLPELLLGATNELEINLAYSK